MDPHASRCESGGEITSRPYDPEVDGRDRPVLFNLRAEYGEALQSSHRLPEGRSAAGDRVIAALGAELIDEARRQGSPRWDGQPRTGFLSISRRRGWWGEADRYLPPWTSRDLSASATDALVEAGWIIDFQKGERGLGKKAQTRFRPAPWLADLKMVKLRQEMRELIVMKDRAGHVIGYDETDRTRSERRFMQTINECLRGADLQLPLSHAWLEGDLLHLDGGKRIVNVDRVELYRVFNGGWTFGGRMFGGYWQNLRKCERKSFFIDGSRAVEEDHEQIHARLLYALAGQCLEGDAYTIDGFTRDEGKLAFNILINAGNYGSALGALAARLGGDKDRARSLILAMKRRHCPVAGHFHSCVGLRLQAFDAAMAKDVLRDLIVKKGIVALPVHDSFIVPERYRGELIKAMDRAFSEHENRLRRTAA